MRGRHQAVLAAVLLIAGGAGANDQFRSEARGVGVHVSVRDGNAPVAGLTADDFELTDNRIPQTVRAVSLDQTPLDVTLVLDVSGSMEGKALTQLQSDIRTMSERLRPDDRLRVLSFASRVTEVQPMSERGAARTRFTLTASGATALYHALVAALLEPAAAGRPHLIAVFTDGADNLSLLDGDDVRALVRFSNAVLHIVERRTGIPSAGLWGWRPFLQYSAKNLADAASASGGALHSVEPTRPLPDVFTQTLEAFRSGYVLWFTPMGVPTAGWHELAVQVKGRRNLTIVARRGYMGG
jgi:VWFA-related protein